MTSFEEDMAHFDKENRRTDIFFLATPLTFVALVSIGLLVWWLA